MRFFPATAAAAAPQVLRLIIAGCAVAANTDESPTTVTHAVDNITIGCTGEGTFCTEKHTYIHTHTHAHTYKHTYILYIHTYIHAYIPYTRCQTRGVTRELAIDY